MIAAALGACALGVVAPSRAQDSGKLVVAHPLGQDDPRIVDLFGGYSLIAWRGQPGTYSQIVYAVLLDSTGIPAPGWPVGGERISPDSFSVASPFLVRLSDDAAALVWTNRLSGTPDGYVAWIRRTNGALPTAADIVRDTVTAREGSQQVLGLIRQDDGHALVALLDRGMTLVKQVGPPGAPGTGWPAQGVVLADSVTVNPSDLESDGQGGALVLTQTFHSCIRNDIGDPPCPTDLKVHHLLPDGSFDPAWPSGGAFLTDHAGWDQYGWVVSDRLGGAYAAWYDTTRDTLRIRAQHLAPDGQPTWGPDGRELAPTTESQVRYILDLDATSTGNLIATLELYWEPHLVALRPDGSIVPGWPAEKRLIPPLTFPDYDFSSDYNTELTPEDWIVVVWHMSTQSTGSNIWGTVLDANGQTLSGWPVGPKAICVAPAGQFRPELALDADQHTFKVVWKDGRLGSSIGLAIYYDRFWLIDGTVPAGLYARLLGHRLDGRALRAAWRVAGGDADSVFALRAVDDAVFAPVSGLARTGAEELTLSDSLPSPCSRARYVLAVGTAAGPRPISDTLEVRLQPEAGRLRLRCAAIQRGASLALRLDLERAAEGVVVAVFDVAGRRVRERRLGSLAAGSHPLTFDLAGERAGLYYVRAYDAHGSGATARVARLR